jgi:peptide/nickel transport system permease protein
MSEAILLPDAAAAERPRSTTAGALRGIGRFIRRKPLGAVGAFILLVLLACALFADTRIITLGQTAEPLLAPYHYDDQDISSTGRLQDPTWEHPFGTDRLGRDMLSQIIYGSRVSIVVGFAAVGAGLLLATAVGVTSGYVGGKLDLFSQRFVDAWIAFPAIIILITGVQLAKAYMGSGATEQTAAIIMVLAIILAAGSSRIIRGATLATKENAYIEAARVLGATESRIIFRHIIPNVIPLVIVVATLLLGVAILAEGTISFLGFGVPPPFPSWGRMLAADGLLFMRVHPWLALWPGLAITLAVWAFNVLGDALRDVLDPRLRGV